MNTSTSIRKNIRLGLFHGVIACAALTVSPGAANAALVDRGGGLIYDTDLNITWMASANVNGAMTWDNAMTWASNLSYYDSVRNVTYTDWRLPTTTDFGNDGCNYSNNGTDCGFNSTGSEMAHLYYNELGNLGYYSPAGVYQPGYGLANTSPFSNLQSYPYWSGTEFAPTSNAAWSFSFDVGYQDRSSKTGSQLALAVRPGDVAAVPVPAAAWLFGSGLLGLIGVARRKG